MKRTSDNFERWLAILLFAIITVLGGWGALSLITNLENRRLEEGLTTLLSNVRSWPDRPAASLRTDITDALRKAGRLPKALKHSQVKLVTGKDELLEIAILNLSPGRCEQLATRLGRANNRRDLYSMWLAGTGQLITDFPPTNIKAGCQGKNIEMRLQYRLQRLSF